MSTDDKNSDGLDLAGVGKVAKAIPPEVYIHSASSVIEIFKKLTAPITETTSGFGRYIRQKFDNMVEVEKALATNSIQSAIGKAESKCKTSGTKIIKPIHEKSFIKSIEEASKETDPTLHEMWTNLLADQLTNINFHPHFVEILPHFSPSEAKLLLSLLPIEKIGENGGRYITNSDDSFKYWVRNSGEEILNKWDYSCVLLLEFKFADILGTQEGQYRKEDKVTLFYRTNAGNTFLSAVSQ
ncbi:MAG: Abi-alpha family protein [Spirochaetota bacterium]|nr:Abi-alpha family protein [Spirochaetota bacterium]